MDPSKHDEVRELTNDKGDLFAAILALGEEGTEFDVDRGAYITVYKRSEQRKEALNAIRKCVIFGATLFSPQAACS